MSEVFVQDKELITVHPGAAWPKAVTMAREEDRESPNSDSFQALGNECADKMLDIGSFALNVSEFVRVVSPPLNDTQAMKFSQGIARRIQEHLSSLPEGVNI